MPPGTESFGVTHVLQLYYTGDLSGYALPSHRHMHASKSDFARRVIINPRLRLLPEAVRTRSIIVRVPTL